MKFVYVVGVALLGLIRLPGGQGEINRVTKGPYLQAPGARTMTIMWESQTNWPGRLWFGSGGQMDQKLEGILPRRMQGVSSLTRTNGSAYSQTNDFYIYAALLTDLKPNTTYAYVVELGETRTLVRKFRTFGPNQDKVTFIAYGDSRSVPKVHQELARNFTRYSPDFILHTGDLVAKGSDYKLWAREYFTPLAEVIGEVPLFSQVGNHEGDATNYLAFFHQPGPGRWYSFEVGPVHVLALDYHFTKATDEQFRFAARDLMASQAPWKIVFLHYPVFNVSGHVTGWGHENYLPLFHQAKVDLVMAGHSHMYERFRPVAPRKEPGQWPVTAITTGGGGANLHLSQPHPALAAQATTNHYLVFEVTRNTLRAQALTALGAVIDNFEITKQNGWPTDDYLQQVYPEELLKALYLVATNFPAKLAALPQPQAPASVMFTLFPAKPLALPLELEISPAPESMPYYELVDGPLRVTLPTGQEKNRVVWARIRAKPVAKVTGKQDSAIAPDLTFQAKFLWNGGVSIAYGSSVSLSKTAAEEAKKLGTVGFAQ
jgi:acid phosphatase type 7